MDRDGFCMHGVIGGVGCSARGCETMTYTPDLTDLADMILAEWQRTGRMSRYDQEKRWDEWKQSALVAAATVLPLLGSQDLSGSDIRGVPDGWAKLDGQWVQLRADEDGIGDRCYYAERPHRSRRVEHQDGQKVAAMSTMGEKLNEFEEWVQHLQVDKIKLRDAIHRALDELGVPDESYPLPVVEAIDVLIQALAVTD
jgi:hypothetical protein